MRGAVLVLIGIFLLAPNLRAEQGTRLLSALSFVPLGDDGLSESLPLGYVDLAAIESAFDIKPVGTFADLDTINYFNFKRQYSNRAFILFGHEASNTTMSNFSILTLAVRDKWKNLIGFDPTEIERVVVSGGMYPFSLKEVALAVLLMRQGSVTTEDMMEALEQTAETGSGAVAQIEDDWFWEVRGLHPITLLGKVFHRFG